jgi:probable selenium-dependent hydroxylase accessory protein YqeC
VSAELPRTADRPSSSSLLDVLAARGGVICAVGAGGKKSTLQRLAETHLAAGTTRIGLTSTVQSAPPSSRLSAERLIAEPAVLEAAVPGAAARCRLLAYAAPSQKPGRLGGLQPGLVAELHRRGGFTVTLVKADGARMRGIKAPRGDEPVLPPEATTVLFLVSAKALGRPLDEAIAHRPELVTAVTGAAAGERLLPVHLARLLASPEGALHGVGEATVVPIINMVEDPERRAGARAAAQLALGLTARFDRVALTAMTEAEPVIEVVTR